MYILAILVFFVALVCITFARDSYLNRELLAYQRMLREPWLNRTVLLTYDILRAQLGENGITLTVNLTCMFILSLVVLVVTMVAFTISQSTLAQKQNGHSVSSAAGPGQRLVVAPAIVKKVK
jgi:hypothetical protein